MEPFPFGLQVPWVQADSKTGECPGNRCGQADKCRGCPDGKCYHAAMHSIPLLPIFESERNCASLCSTCRYPIKKILLPGRIIKGKRAIKSYMRVTFPIALSTKLLYDKTGNILYPPSGTGKTDLDKIGVVHALFATGTGLLAMED